MRWRRRIKVGDLVLVCDVGGGTTDLSLIVVSEENGELTLKRVAVGDHILLGGDNMDLALARVLQQRLEASGNRIDTWQLHGLWHQCRIEKEKLFESPKTQKHPITLLGKGTKLIGGTIKTELAREDLDQVLVEGFFPKVASGELPARQRRVGFQELGLPYAADPAITKHLARFLSEQVRNSPEAASIRRGRSGLACPTHILFNGGVMKAAVLRDRVVEVLNSWLQARRIRRARGRANPGSARPGARGGARRGLLREGAARSRRAYPQWRLAHVLHRNRKRNACSARHGSSAQGALCRSLWHGGGHRGHDSRTESLASSSANRPSFAS